MVTQLWLAEEEFSLSVPSLSETVKAFLIITLIPFVVQPGFFSFCVSVVTSASKSSLTDIVGKFSPVHENLFLSSLRMQDPRVISSEDVINPKTQKKKSSSRGEVGRHSLGNVKGRPETIYPPFKAQKVLKGKPRNEASPSFQHPERSNSDSLPDNSSGSEYRILRRKYLLLEEKSFLLKNELNEAEAEIRTLEKEKFALLDQLLVLEGLIDPADIHPQERS